MILVLLLFLLFSIRTLGLEPSHEGTEIVVESKTNIDSTLPQKIESPTLPQSPKKDRREKKRGSLKPSSLSNLPNYYFKNQIVGNRPTESQVILPDNSIKEVFLTLKPGDILEAQVEHSVIAFPNEKAPVIAQILQGSFKGSKLVGFSRLETNSKRIFIDFELLSPLSRTHSFEFKGSGLTEIGTPGFEGKYYSKEIKYFTGDFISTFVAAYFDAQVPRFQSPLGGTIEDTSLNSATKKAFSQSAMSSAERFREKLKNTPEFSELTGPFPIRILVLSTPIEK